MSSNLFLNYKNALEIIVCTNTFVEYFCKKTGSTVLLVDNFYLDKTFIWMNICMCKLILTLKLQIFSQSMWFNEYLLITIYLFYFPNREVDEQISPVTSRQNFY